MGSCPQCVVICADNLATVANTSTKTSKTFANDIISTTHKMTIKYDSILMHNNIMSSIPVCKLF